VAHVGLPSLIAGALDVVADWATKTPMSFWVGPCVAPADYTFTMREADQLRRQRPDVARNLVRNHDGCTQLNLYALIVDRLTGAGGSVLGPGPIFSSNDPRYYSRRTRSRTGQPRGCQMVYVMSGSPRQKVHTQRTRLEP